MLRAVVVGFILGFALIGVLRLSDIGTHGPQLTSGQVTFGGAAVDHVAVRPREPDQRPVLLLI